MTRAIWIGRTIIEDGAKESINILAGKEAFSEEDKVVPGSKNNFSNWLDFPKEAELPQPLRWRPSPTEDTKEDDSGDGLTRL